MSLNETQTRAVLACSGFGERVKPWQDGDARAHCTHCDCCGFLFRTAELGQHQREAHLGGYRQEQAHLREGARLFLLSMQIDSGSYEFSEAQISLYSMQAATWLVAECERQKEVRR